MDNPRREASHPMHCEVPAPRFFTLSESQSLAEGIAREGGLALSALEERRFEGGEFKLRPLESTRDRLAFVVQSLAGSEDAPTSDRLLRLLFLLQGLRDAGAAQRIALLPYLAFARKDRRTQPRDPVTSRYVAELLEAAGATRVVALDVHNPAAFDNAFRIPTDHLSALPLMAAHLASVLARERLAVASPDVGGVKRAQLLREMLEKRLGREIPLVFIEKRRAQGVLSGGTLVGDVEGSTVIVIDDLCATGTTLIRAAEACRRAGAAAVHAAVTHIPNAAGVTALLDAAALSAIIVTDSVGAARAAPSSAASASKLVMLSVAPLFGQAVQRMLAGKPLAPLLSEWPLPPGA